MFNLLSPFAPNIAQPVRVMPESRRSFVRFQISAYSVVALLIMLLNTNAVFATNEKNVANMAKRSAPASIAKPPLAVLYDALVPRLLGGGLVLYVVPFETIGEDRADLPNWWRECPYTKQISPNGIRQAQTVGRAISNLSAPFGLIQSSEVCTSLSTTTFVARNKTRIFQTPDLNPVFLQRQAGLKDAVVKVKIQSHFEAGIWRGTNSLLSGFQLTPETAPHPVLAELAAGESAIFEVTPVGEVILLARLNWRQWEEMSEYMVAKLNNAGHKRRAIAKK